MKKLILFFSLMFIGTFTLANSLEKSSDKNYLESSTVIFNLDLVDRIGGTISPCEAGSNAVISNNGTTEQATVAYNASLVAFEKALQENGWD